MTFKKLLADKRVALEPPSKQELDELREVVATNLADADVPGLSPQGRYEFAYNAARLAATMAVRATGHRVTARNGFHYYTFQALEAVHPAAFGKHATYFDAARSKRNDFSYDGPTNLTDTEATELVAEAKRFLTAVEAWIAAHAPLLK